MELKMNLKNCVLVRLKHPKTPLQNKQTWCIAEFTNHEKKKTFTGIGNIINPSINMEYSLLNGQWVPNTYMGRTEDQFQFEYAQIEQPKDEKGISMYLSKYINGLGFNKISQILNEFGIDTIEKLKNSPSIIALKIKGISKEFANEISETLLKMEEIEQQIIELESVLGDIKGLPKKAGEWLINNYGASAYDELKMNPYILTRMPGIGFLLADKVAIESFQIKPDSIFRQQAGIEHILKQENNKGNVWADTKSVKYQATVLLGQDIEAGYGELIDICAIIKNDDFITFYHHDANEKLIASRVHELINNNSAQYQKVGE